MPTVSTAHFNVLPGARDCRSCRWFDGMMDRDAAYCRHPECSRVRSGAASGCVSWRRREPQACDPRPEPPPNW